MNVWLTGPSFLLGVRESFIVALSFRRPAHCTAIPYTCALPRRFAELLLAPAVARARAECVGPALKSPPCDRSEGREHLILSGPVGIRSADGQAPEFLRRPGLAQFRRRWCDNFVEHVDEGQ